MEAIGLKDKARPKEKRLHPRFDCDGRIKCVLELAGRRHSFLVCDISRGGMKLKSKNVGLFEHFQAGENVAIHSLTGDKSIFPQDLSAMVVWFAGTEDWLIVGIQFLDELNMTPAALMRALATCGRSLTGTDPISSAEN
ncbi:MAG: PilZ domain-containing protein [Desulfovibrionaceae bacterium]|nr:PilZ domain-containing protein [Desulfovibrionaceae bacterium]